MLEKPLEWRRFEPVELEGEVVRVGSRAMGPRFAEPNPMVREFERVLRDNERLQNENVCLRAELLKYAATPDVAREREQQLARLQEDLDASRAQVERLQAEITALKDFRQQTPPAPISIAAAQPEHPETSAVATSPSPTVAGAAEADVAEVVASYLFAEPTAPQLRLVSDALRARGVIRD